MERTRPFLEINVRGVPLSSYRPSARTSRLLLDCGAVGVAVVTISIFSYYRLQGTPWEIGFWAAFAGIKPVLGATLTAAIEVWSFWALTAVVGAGILTKLDPEIDSFDAFLGGAAGAWMVAYILGQTLGPIGLFRGPVIWILLIAATGWILLTTMQLVMPRLTWGRGMAILAFLLISVGLVPLEL